MKSSENEREMGNSPTPTSSVNTPASRGIRRGRIFFDE